MKRALSIFCQQSSLPPPLPLLTSDTGPSCGIGEATRYFSLRGEGGGRVLEACGHVDARPLKVSSEYSARMENAPESSVERLPMSLASEVICITWVDFPLTILIYSLVDCPVLRIHSVIAAPHN